MTWVDESTRVRVLHEHTLPSVGIARWLRFVVQAADAAQHGFTIRRRAASVAVVSTVTRVWRGGLVDRHPHRHVGGSLHPF